MIPKKAEPREKIRSLNWKYPWTTLAGLALFVVFLLPGSVLASLQPERGWLKKLLSPTMAHGGGNGFFALILGLEASKHNFFSLPRVGLISLLYGLAIEIVQAILPWRSFEVKDLAADAVGVGLSLLFFLTIRPSGELSLFRRNKRRGERRFEGK